MLRWKDFLWNVVVVDRWSFLSLVQEITDRGVISTRFAKYREDDEVEFISS